MKISRVIVPIIILIIAVGVAVAIVSMKPKPTRKMVEQVIPGVEVQELTLQDVTLRVHSRGSVDAKLKMDLTPGVSGKIVEMSPDFNIGEYFEEGEVLLKIDPTDYRMKLALERSNLAQAELNLAEEQAFADQAVIDWEDLGRGDPSELALHIPHLRRAQARMESAQAQVTKAELDLERTAIKAPYDGRVQKKLVSLGQYVTGAPGTTLAKIYATGAVEVRLPLTNTQMSQLELPYVTWDDDEAWANPEVLISIDYGGRSYEWQGYLIRSEAAIDNKTRLNYVVAEVMDPYAADLAQPRKPPLQVGMFVEADIAGRKVTNAFVLPRHVVLEDDVVLVVDENDKLYRRAVSILQKGPKQVVIDQGLQVGDRIVLSPVEFVVDGMPVQVQ